MRRAVTAKSWLKTCSPQSRLSLELSGEAEEMRLPPLVQIILYFSAAKVACKRSLIAALCCPAALLIEHAQAIKVTGRGFFRLFIFISSVVHVIEYSVARQEVRLEEVLTLQSYVR